MDRQLPGTTRLLTRVRARAGVGSALLNAGRGLVVGAIAAGVLVACGKLVPMAWAVDWRLLAALGVTAVVGGLVLGLLRTPSILVAAARADAALGTSDRFRAAVELAGASSSDPFVRSLVIEAERLATGARPGAISPIRAGRAWVFGLPLLAMAVGAAIWLPARTAGATRTGVPRVREAEAEAERAADAIARVRDIASESSNGLAPVADNQQIERLDALEAELRTGLDHAEDARARAASAASELAERASEAAERNTLVAERLGELARSTGHEASSATDANEESSMAKTEDTPLGPLLDRLGEGDLSGASDELSQLAQDAPSMSADERSNLAGQLESLAERLERAATGESAANPPSPTDQSSAPERRATDPVESPSDERPSPSETAPQGASQDGSESAVSESSGARDRTEGSETPRSDGTERAKDDPIDQSQAQEESDRARRSQEATEEAAKDARELASGAREAAEELRRRPERPGADGQRSDQTRPDQSRANRDNAPGGSQEGERRGAESDPASGTPSQVRPGGEPGAERSDDGNDPSNAGERTGSRERASPGEHRSSGKQGADSPGSRPDESARTSPTQDSPGDRPQPSPSSASDAEQGQGETAPNETPQAVPVPRAGEDPKGDPSSADEPTETGDRAPEQRPERDPNRGTEPNAGEGPFEKLQRAMKEAAGRPDAARQQRQAADRLRQIADDLASDTGQSEVPGREGQDDDRPVAPEGRGTPGAAGGNRTGAGSQLGPERAESTLPAGSFTIEDVAGPRAREPVGGGRVAGERPSDPSAQEATIPPVTPARLQEAAAGAERAIEQQSVPDRRSELVRRVFRRYAERAQTPGTAPGAASERPASEPPPKP